jgi:pimeloyl-ACP methyl ester carboxylesterase
MRIFNVPIFFIFTMLVLISTSCSENDEKPIPAANLPIDSLSSGAGSFTYTYSVTNFSKTMNVYYYIPENKTETTEVLIVLHGDGRNAKDYRDALITDAQTKGFIVIAPEFSEQNFPNGDGYNLGNVFIDGDNPTATTLNPEAKWSFSIIEPLFDFVKTQINNSTPTYALFGHSAGGQFVHRFLMFKPNARINKAVVSAPGWYTFPNMVIFPYGRNQSPLQNMNLSTFFAKNIHIQVGKNDNDPNAAGLRHNAFADAQGLNRKQRAENYFQFCQQLAGNATFNWNFHVIENANHDYVKASKNAVNLLFN